MWNQTAPDEGTIPLTNAQAATVHIADRAVLTGWTCLVDVLPCERCWWMPADCTCGRPEARAELFRLAPPSATDTGQAAA